MVNTEDNSFKIPFWIVFAFILVFLIVLAIIIYCWWKKVGLFSESTSSSETYQSTTTMIQDSTGAFGGLNVLHLKTINGVPSPGSSFPRPPVSVSLLTIFPDQRDKELVTREPNRFRLFFHSAHFKNTRSPPMYPHSGGQSGFARYEAPLELVEKGKYEIHCYAVVWRGPTPLAPPNPPAVVTREILNNFCVKFEYFVGTDAKKWQRGTSASNSILVDINQDSDDDRDNDGSNDRSIVSGNGNLLDMQRQIARHLFPPPGTYVAPIDVHVSTTLCDRYKINISPQHMITANDTQMFTLSVTGNHIVKLTSRNSHVDRSLDMAAVYVMLPPPPDIVPNRGSITELMPISIASPACIADVNLKHFYVVDAGSSAAPNNNNNNNSEPNMLYTNPFTVPCGEGNAERPCRIIARTIGRDGTQSDPAIADLQVLSSNVAVYDPSIPSPVCVVSALEPRLVLYFNDGTANGDQTGYLPSDVVFYYRVVKDEMKRHMYSIERDDSGFEGDDGRFKIYNPAVAIAINDSHCRIEAYAERISGGNGGGTAREQSIVAHYSWTESMAEAAHGPYDSSRMQSRAQTPSRQTSARREQQQGQGNSGNAQNKHSIWNQQQNIRNQVNQGLHAGQSLRPPIMSVVCSGATMAFDDPPHKNFVVRYSLDGAALDENWREFQSGTEVDVSEYLRAFGKIEVFARYYVERISATEPTRFGRSFSRDFTMPFFSSNK